MDIASHSDLRAHRRNIDHIAGKQGRILGHIAKNQQIVQIEMGDGLAISPELDVAQGALNGWSAGGKQSGDKGAERTQGVGAGAASLADDKDLNRTQLAHLDIEIETLVNVADSIVKMLLNLRIGKPATWISPTWGRYTAPERSTVSCALKFTCPQMRTTS